MLWFKLIGTLDSRRLKHRRNLLVPVVLCQRFLVVEAEGAQHGQILDRKKDGIRVRRRVRVLVQRPGRQSDDVALAPFELLPVDDRRAVALDDIIHGAAGMAVRLGAFAGPQQLDHAGHRRQHRAAGLRMTVLQQDAVEGTALMVAQRCERL